MTTMIETSRRDFTDAELPAVRVLSNKPVAFNLWNEFFRIERSLPARWEMVTINCSEEVAPKGFAKVEGGFRSAKGKWRGRDKSGDATFFVKMEDLRAYEKKRASEAGVCHRCWGEGRVSARISVDKTKNTYRCCPICDGTGDPHVEVSK